MGPAADAAGPWLDAPLAAVDLEMTGLDPEVDRICEVGVVRGRRGRVEDRWSRLVSPGVRMTPGARAVHKIPDAALREAPPFEEIAEDLAARLEGRVCVAHRAEVDRRFLEDAFARCHTSPPEVVWLDTLSLARSLLALRSHRLASLVRMLGLEASPSHRALGDAEAAFGVLHALVDLLQPPEDWSLGALCAVSDRLASDGEVMAAREAALREAATAGRRLRVAYLSRDDAGCWRRTEREVDVQRVRPPRVEVYCHLRGADRVFRLERIHLLEDVSGRGRGVAG